MGFSETSSGRIYFEDLLKKDPFLGLLWKEYPYKISTINKVIRTHFFGILQVKNPSKIFYRKVNIYGGYVFRERADLLWSLVGGRHF